MVLIAKYTIKRRALVVNHISTLLGGFRGRFPSVKFPSASMVYLLLEAEGRKARDEE